MNDTATTQEPRRSTAPGRIALMGNPNTGKTTVFNRLCGLRHKTSNFPGTTQEARLGLVRGMEHAADAPTAVIDLPGIYSLELDQPESEVCRRVLAGELAPAGETASAPDAVLVVVDATNLARNLLIVGEAMRRRLPMVVALNMMDLARRQGLPLNPAALAEELGVPVVECSAREGEGMKELVAALRDPRVPNRTPPGTQEGLETWADGVYANVMAGAPARAATGGGAESVSAATDRLDRIFTHPVGGVAAFAAVMGIMFYAIFRVAQYPMGWIETIFERLGGLVRGAMPEGPLRDLLADGVVGAVGSTVVFLPQICLLFFMITLLEDTGYLARAAFVVDRWLRPFGLPGHSFVPLLSSHACALPGIMSARGVPDRRDRLATILVAPFMSCSARVPVYVLLTGLLFRDSPGMQALAMVGCYVLGLAAGLLSALIARRGLLRGSGRPMALELPTYKRPSLRNAVLGTFDRALIFLKKAGTVILAICIVLWWLSAYPALKETPPEATTLRAQAQAAAPPEAEELAARADRIEARAASANSYMGRIGKAMAPVFEPIGADWRLTVGIMASFAAREVFVGTMAIVVSGEETEDEGALRERLSQATRDDGTTPLFARPVCWSMLVFYVLAMQCLPTLAVTAREAGGVRWALLQLAWMSAVAYAGAWIAFRIAGGF